jgi:ribosomal protein S18 acetylase RimI-like enzyme
MGIEPRQGLSLNELVEIRRLAELCNQAEGIQLKLNWDMLKERSQQHTNDFLYYEDGQLVVFLGIYSFQSTEAEISGMVHPDYRRRDIFGQLVEAALDACRQRSFPKLIFICQNGSASGKAFLASLGTVYSFSEYLMELTDVNAARDNTAEKKADLEILVATKQDVETLVKLNSSGFSMSEQDAREYVLRTIESKSERTLMAKLNGVPIGKLGIQLEEGSAFIYGFCVLPEYRGQGYGRAILSETIQLLQDKEQSTAIALEVAIENKGALGLYQSCGFQEQNVNDYYELYL